MSPTQEESIEETRKKILNEFAPEGVIAVTIEPYSSIIKVFTQNPDPEITKKIEAAAKPFKVRIIKIVHPGRKIISCSHIGFPEDCIEA